MLARTLAGLVAIIAWIGLAVQFHASYATHHTVAATLWAMLLYFTVIANLLVALLFTATALGRSKVATSVRLGGVTIAIILVGVVYNLLLTGMIELSGGAKLADFINHTFTPVIVTAYWFFIAGKGQLQWGAPLRWAALPVIYFAYAIARGSIEGKYPYPFMNLPQLGWQQTIVNAGLMALAFVAVGFAMVWIDRRLASSPSTQAQVGNPARGKSHGG